MHRNVTLYTALLASLSPHPTTERHGLFTWFASAISILKAIHFNSTNAIHNIVTNSTHLGVLYEGRKEGRKTPYVMTTSFRP
jgi:hypothetical protein